MQPDKYSEDAFKMKFRRTQRRLRSTQKAAVLDYEELGGLSDPGPRDTHMAYIF
jgi:hypothetical protein